MNISLPVTDGEILAEEAPISKHGRLFNAFLDKFPPWGPITNTFDHWIEVRLPEQIYAKNKRFGNYFFEFDRFQTEPPRGFFANRNPDISPIDAILRKSFYNFSAKVDFNIYYINSKGNKELLLNKEVALGKIPCMVHSARCNLYGLSPDELMKKGEDMRGVGGYFIANGLERVIFWSEMLRINRFNCNTDSKNQTSFCYVTADTPRGTLVTTLIETKEKITNISPIHIMVSGRKRKKFNQKKNTEETINVLSLLQYYIELNQNIIDEESYEKIYAIVSNPYSFLDLIRRFVQPEHHEIIETYFADTILEFMQPRIRVETFLQNIIRESDIDFKQKKTEAPPRVIIDQDYLELANSAILPHISSDQPKRKIYTIAMMIAMTLEHMAGIRSNTEKDHWENKRLVSPSKRCEQLIRTALRKYINEIYALVESKLPKSRMRISDDDLKCIDHELNNIINSGNTITAEFQTAFTGPKFGSQNTSAKAKNPVQMLQRKTHIEMLTMINRTEAPIDRKTRSASVRAVQPNQWRYLCMGKATENSAVGITKSKAVTCQVTVNGDNDAILSILRGELSVAYDKEDDIHLENYLNVTEGSPVMLNGEFIGWTSDGANLANVLRQARRGGTIDRYVCVIHDEFNYVHIHNDEGRLVSPVIIVDENGKVNIPWNILDSDPDPIEYLISNRYIEFIDAWEQDYIRVATSENLILDWIDQLAQAQDQKTIDFLIENRFTHLELHPQALFGVGLSTMPFPEFEQAPRDSYESQMVKQKMGTPNTNRFDRFDDDAKYMVTPSRPLVTVQSEKRMFLDNFPNGRMLQVTFNNKDGDTQEDSTMLSEEGAKLLSISHYFVFDEILTNNDTLTLPPEELIGSRFEHGDKKTDVSKAVDREKSRYKFICDNGLPMINAPLNPGDYIIGKISVVEEDEVSPTSGTIVVKKLANQYSKKLYKNSSVYLDVGQYGIVDGVKVLEIGDVRVLVRLRRDRTFKVADKLESRYAQKNTCSHILPKHKLPFDELTGEMPDIIMNTHSIPKRMTTGYILEVLYSIRCALLGKRYNGTCFEHHDIDEAYDLIHKMGFDPQGYRWMVDPETGERYKAMVFMGPIQICTLTHLGEEKLQIRSTGPVRILTRQPPRNSKYGGRRFGGMEVNTVLYHGCIKFLIDLMVNKSDAYTVLFCKTCGYFAIMKVLGDETVASCQLCDAAERDYIIERFTIPYVFKLLTQLMFGVGILIHLDLSNLSDNVEDQLESIIEEDEEEEEELEESEEEGEEEDPINRVQDPEDDENQQIEYISDNDVQDEYEYIEEY